MSVYTPLSHSQLATVLDSYGYRLLDFRAASHGIGRLSSLTGDRIHRSSSPVARGRRLTCEFRVVRMCD